MVSKPPLLGVPAETEHEVVHGHCRRTPTPPGTTQSPLTRPLSHHSINPPQSPVQALHSQLAKPISRCLEKGWRTAEEAL